MKDKLAYQVNGKPKSAPDGVDWILIRASKKAAREEESSHKQDQTKPDVQKFPN